MNKKTKDPPDSAKLVFDGMAPDLLAPTLKTSNWLAPAAASCDWLALVAASCDWSKWSFEAKVEEYSPLMGKPRVGW